jgi:hypothetical protein
LKLIIASLVVFSVIILFLFALFPSDISVTRVVEINCSRENLIGKIADLRTWPKWNLLLAAPSANSLSNNHANQIDSGFLNIGGVLVSLLYAGPDSIVTRWQHNSKTFSGIFHLTGVDDRVVLEWKLNFHVKWYPWDKLASMFYEKEIGPVMEQSLVKLQAVAENR